MALRRPPTRIELKADDVEEYDKVRSIYFVFISCAALNDAVLSFNSAGFFDGERKCSQR